MPASTSLQVVLRRAGSYDQYVRSAVRRVASAPRSASCRQRYWPVSDSPAPSDLAGVPSATTSPPCTPAPGPMSTTWSAARIASSSCSTTITVLPRSRRSLERVEQTVVVALVQADRRLVQHVQHADQAAADLGGQADALALAAGQRAGVARERQVVEADIDEEAQPLADLLEDPDGDLPARPSAAASRRTRARRSGIAARDLADVCGRCDLDRSASGLSRRRRRPRRVC